MPLHHYLYLIIDILSVLFPLIFSFHQRFPFYKKWKYLLPSIIIPASIFIGWDVWFTQIGVWGFNPYYLTGIYFFNLPLEEVLFFICIPYACMFTYFAVNSLTKEKIGQRLQQFLTDALIFGLLAIGGLNYYRWYTSVTFILTGILFVFIRKYWKPDFIGRFYYSFIFILIPFFIVNGILTGSGIKDEVVWYNNFENLHIRLGTIPIEDVFYGMLLILMNVSIFEYLQKNKSAVIK